MKATDFNRAFDAGEEVIEFLDVASATRPMQTTKRVNVDFPVWMVEKLDREARRLGGNTPVGDQVLVIRAVRGCA